MNKIISQLNSLVTVLQESAEHGDMDSIVYVSILELMGELIECLKSEVSAHE